MSKGKGVNWIAVTNRKLCEGDFLEQIRLLADSGVHKIILREKDLSPDEYERLAEQVLRICEGTRTECVLHSYLDVAEHLHAKKIHMPLSIFDSIIGGENQVIQKNQDNARTRIQESEKDSELYVRLAQFDSLGFSTHSIEQVRQAEQILRKVKQVAKSEQIMTEANAYLTAGHIFATDCKKGLPPRGIPFLQEMVAATSLPVYAIGGISPQNAHEAIEVGAAGVCLMSWCMRASEADIAKIYQLLSRV